MGLVSARFTDVVVISLSIWSCVVVMGGGSTWTLEGSFTPVWLGDDHDGLVWRRDLIKQKKNFNNLKITIIQKI